MTKRKALLYMIITALLWSTGGILIKLVDWNPIAIAGMRSGIAAIVMIPFVPFHKNLITKNRIIGALFYSSTLILFVSANKLTTSANAIFLQFTAPIWIVLYSRYFMKVHFRRSDLISILVVFFGMGLFFLDSLDSGRLLGNILGLLSGFSFAGMILSLKQQSKESPLNTIFMGNILNFILCIPFYFLSFPSPKSILGLILLGTFQVGLAYILYARSLEHLNIIEITLIPVIEPLLNPVWVFLFIGETPGFKAILGGIIVVAALVIRSIYQNQIPPKKSVSESI